MFAGRKTGKRIYLDSLLAKLPPDVEKLNMEAVIEIQVTGGHPGPPSILAVETWWVQEKNLPALKRIRDTTNRLDPCDVELDTYKLWM